MQRPQSRLGSQSRRQNANRGMTSPQGSALSFAASTAMGLAARPSRGAKGSEPEKVKVLFSFAEVCEVCEAKTMLF